MHLPTVRPSSCGGYNPPQALSECLINKQSICSRIRNHDRSVRATERSPCDERRALRFETRSRGDTAHACRACVLGRCDDFEVY
jgi:hypothetical protein